MKTRIKVVATLVLSGALPGLVFADFGVGMAAYFNYKASFHSGDQELYSWNDPGLAVSGVDHIYDDGYNRIDSSGNFENETTYWGYQNAAQADGASITMNSTREFVQEVSSEASQNGMLPAIEIFWEKDIIEKSKWNCGLRTVLRWQWVELESRVDNGTAEETISDSYAYDGSIPGAPFNGSYTGPNFLLSDIPDRNVSTVTGSSIVSSRKLEANIIGFDLGPTFAWELNDVSRLTMSAGGSMAWINSKFTYSEGSLLHGSSSESGWCFGFYLGADIQYKVSEQWGLLFGAVFTSMQHFEHTADGLSAELQMDEIVSIRAGITF